ncbi:MAG: hypothetical protein ACFHHU_13495 [Porticoccaceae bacterium]
MEKGSAFSRRYLELAASAIRRQAFLEYNYNCSVPIEDNFRVSVHTFCFVDGAMSLALLSIQATCQKHYIKNSKPGVNDKCCLNFLWGIYMFVFGRSRKAANAEGEGS